jgi:hypothetical protein
MKKQEFSSERTAKMKRKLRYAGGSRPVKEKCASVATNMTYLSHHRSPDQADLARLTMIDMIIDQRGRPD